MELKRSAAEDLGLRICFAWQAGREKEHGATFGGAKWKV